MDVYVKLVGERLQISLFYTCSPIALKKGGLIIKKYTCTVCGFVYDEAEGYPEDGITPGTK